MGVVFDPLLGALRTVDNTGNTYNITNNLKIDQTGATGGTYGALSGAVNGTNTTFTLANTPLSGTEQVYLNGVLQEPGAGNDYTISGTTITYLTAPLSTDRLRVSYQK